MIEKREKEKGNEKKKSSIGKKLRESKFNVGLKANVFVKICELCWHGTLVIIDLFVTIGTTCRFRVE
jgi:hypothetical protein